MPRHAGRLVLSAPPDPPHLDRARRIEAWTWVLLYGGLLAVALSLFIPAAQPALACGLRLGGGLAALVGLLLIVLRSRMRP